MFKLTTENVGWRIIIPLTVFDGYNTTLTFFFINKIVILNFINLSEIPSTSMNIINRNVKKVRLLCK